MYSSKYVCIVFNLFDLNKKNKTFFSKRTYKIFDFEIYNYNILENITALLYRYM